MYDELAEIEERLEAVEIDIRKFYFSLRENNKVRSGSES